MRPIHLVRLAELGEAIGCVMPDRREQPVARLTMARTRRRRATARPAGRRRPDEPRLVAAGTNGCGADEGEASREDRQAAAEPAAPARRAGRSSSPSSPKRPAPRLRRVAPSRTQEVEAPIEMRCDLFGRKAFARAAASSIAKRDPVELTADPRRLLGARLAASAKSGRTAAARSRKQRGLEATSPSSSRLGPVTRDRKRCKRVVDLPCHPEALPARRQHSERLDARSKRSTSRQTPRARARSCRERERLRCDAGRRSRHRAQRTPGASGTPRASIRECVTSTGSRTSLRSTKQTRSTLSAACLAATSASRVLPTPPSPVTVTSRASPSRRSMSSSSRSRPTKLVSGTGRLCQAPGAGMSGTSCRRIARCR